MAALVAKLPSKYLVTGPRTVDVLDARRPLVMVIRTNTEPAPNYSGSYLSTFAIWVIQPKQIAPDDDLDDDLDAVILALDAYDFVAWTGAERSTYLDDYPAYRLTANTIDSKD
jgi:hypothetical protein